MENKFEVGDKVVKKGSRDSAVMVIVRIHYRFGLEPTYEIKPLISSGGRQMIGEEALVELYNKVNKP